MPYPVGDINQDGTVNSFDLSILLANWGTSHAGSDINNDGVVNAFDLSLLLGNWGATGGEPEGGLYETFNGPINTSIWQRGSWREHGGQMAHSRLVVGDGKLQMQFIYDSAQGFLSSGMQTYDTFLYGLWEGRLKPSPVPGVINSFHTIDWDEGNGSRQEVDIEFVTANNQQPGEGEMHCAIHAAGQVNHWVRTAQLDFNPSADFHIYGLNILPDRVQWIVDGVVVETYIYAQHQVVINRPYQFKMNHWSSMTSNWVKGPPPVDTLSNYEIDWIRFTPLSV